MSACLAAMFHYVRDADATPFPGINALRVSDFERQLDLLAENFDVVDLESLVDHLDARRPFDRPSAVLTFDDGFVDHYETVFPLLRARGWSGVFFLAGATLGDAPAVLNVHKAHFLSARLGADVFESRVLGALHSSAVRGAGLARTADVYRYDRDGKSSVKHLLNYELPYEVVDPLLGELFEDAFGAETVFARSLYLSAAQARDMAAGGMAFGYHTRTHRVMSRLAPEQQREELAGGVAAIQALSGSANVSFCFPYGHRHTFDDGTLSLLQELGFSCAFSTERRLIAPAMEHRFALPRFDTRDLPPFYQAFPHA